MISCSHFFALLFVLSSLCFFFFFQAEDGIRDLIVTGVQTCALPIYTAAGAAITTRARPRNSPRPSCSNDLRLMNPSPVRVFAFLITRAVGFVKVADGRVDWWRVFPLSLSETDPDAPV